jgi:hypothetical protein
LQLLGEIMPRGSRPGERRGGRKRGTPNRISTEIRDAARRYGREALQLHVKLMRASKNEDVRQRSANVILDRAYGKPAQSLSTEDDNPLQLLMQHLEGTSRGLPSDHR